MKKKEVGILAVILISISVVLYSLHYFLFKDIHHISLFFMGDLAFIPIEVLFVTVLIERTLTKDEKKNALQKLNISIGVFFNEVGTEALRSFANADSNIENIRDTMIINTSHSNREVEKMKKAALVYISNIDIDKIDLLALKELLTKERTFFIRLLENPMFSQHDTFTKMIQAIFHLQDELRIRATADYEMTEIDRYAIKKDIERVYKYLSYEWIVYLEYTIQAYPYLFLATYVNNPFDSRPRKILEKEAYMLSLKLREAKSAKNVNISQ